MPPTAPVRGRGPLVTALLVGLLVGGGGVGAAWALTGSGEDAVGYGPASDAQGACAALAGFDESKYAAKGAEGEVALHRWSGAVVLAEAAAAGDPAHEPLADALRRAANRQRQVFEFDAQVMKELATAREICAAR
jgi:hypothetical protein